MIRREAGENWLLISQVDHAHLAAEMATAWETPALPEPDGLLPAIRDHDEGWREWERLPDIDPQTGLPRNFTEMPASEAVRIWSRSIETCRRGRHSIVDSVDAFRRFLSLAGLRLTHERAIIAEEVFSSWEAFSAADILERLPERDDGRKVSKASVSRTLTLMEEAHLLRKVSRGTYRDVFEQTHRIGGGSTLAGIWVSRHFTFLAERAREHDKAGAPIWGEFIEEQRHFQSSWAAEIQKEFGAKRAYALIDQGTRWLQFFDLLSLWLCCGERTETESFETPNNQIVHFTPLKSGEIAVEPYPFSAPALLLNADAKRTSKKIYSDRAEFQNDFEQSKSESLEWKLVCW